MGRSSSIGSPLLSIIRERSSRSLREGLPSTIPPRVSRFLNATSPRAFREALTHRSVLDVTVSVFPSVATRDGFLARTTFLTTDWQARSRLVTEFWWSLAFHHLQLSELTGQRVPRERWHNPGAALLFRVWTLPGITRQGRKVQPVLSSAGSVLDLSPA